MFFTGGTPRRCQFLEDPVVLQPNAQVVKTKSRMVALYKRTTGEEAEHNLDSINSRQFRKHMCGGGATVRWAPAQDTRSGRRNLQHHSTTLVLSTESELQSASTHRWARPLARAKPPIFRVSPKSDLLASGSVLRMRVGRMSLRRTDDKT